MNICSLYRSYCSSLLSTVTCIEVRLSFSGERSIYSVSPSTVNSPPQRSTPRLLEPNSQFHSIPCRTLCAISPTTTSGSVRGFEIGRLVRTLVFWPAVVYRFGLRVGRWTWPTAFRSRTWTSHAHAYIRTPARSAATPPTLHPFPLPLSRL